MAVNSALTQGVATTPGAVSASTPVRIDACGADFPSAYAGRVCPVPSSAAPAPRSAGWRTAETIAAAYRQTGLATDLLNKWQNLRLQFVVVGVPLRHMDSAAVWTPPGLAVEGRLLGLPLALAFGFGALLLATVWRPALPPQNDD